MSQYVNLFNPALRERRDPLSIRVVLSLAGAAMVIVVLIGVFARYTTVELEAKSRDSMAHLKQEQAKLLALTKQTAERKPDAKLSADLARAEAVLRARSDLVRVIESGSFGNSEGFSEPMRAFARQSLHGLWLTGFSIRAGASEMEINGRALNAELLPIYIRRLNSEPAFQGKNFAMFDLRSVPAEKPELAKGSVPPVGGKPLPPHVEFSLGSKARRIDLAEQR